MGDALGTGTHEVWVTDRSNGAVIGRLSGAGLSFVQWSRRRDDTSSARVVVLSPDAACCDFLGETRTIRNDLVIFRNGRRVWEGVITYLSYAPDEVEIVANDMSWFFNHRACERTYDYTSSKVAATTLAAQTMLKDHYPPNNPWGVTVTRLASAGEARTSVRVEAWETTVGSQLQAWGDRGGIDWAIVGRRVTLWDTHLRHTVLPLLDESYFLNDLRVVEYGSDLATRIVRTSSSKVTVVSAEKVWTDYYGVVDKVERDESADQTSTEGQAVVVDQITQRLTATTPVPNVVVMPANTTVVPEVPVPIERWVPGAWAIVQSARTCRPLRSWLKLDAVTVTEKDGAENVAVTFTTAPRAGVDAA